MKKPSMTIFQEINPNTVESHYENSTGRLFKIIYGPLNKPFKGYMEKFKCSADYIHIIAPDINSAKKEFWKIYGTKIRNIIIEFVETNSGHTIFTNSYKSSVIWDDNFIYIYTSNKAEIVWNDSSNSDSPEDLCWGRDIGSLFKKAFEMGVESTKETN